MWSVYLIFFSVLVIFFALDSYFERFGEIFACRGYDMLAKVSHKSRFVPSSGTMKHAEHLNKTKILENA